MNLERVKRLGCISAWKESSEIPRGIEEVCWLVKEGKHMLHRQPGGVFVVVGGFVTWRVGVGQRR